MLYQVRECSLFIPGVGTEEKLIQMTKFHHDPYISINHPINHATCFHFCPLTSFFHFTIFNACTTSNPEPNPISIYPDLNPNPNPYPEPNPNPNPNPDPNPKPDPNPNTRTIDWNPLPLLTLKSNSTTSHTLKPHLQLNHNQTQSPLRHIP